MTGHSKESTQLVVYSFRKMARNHDTIIYEMIRLPYTYKQTNLLSASKFSIGLLKNSLVYGHSSKPLEQSVELEIVVLDGEIRIDLPMKQ